MRGSYGTGFRAPDMHYLFAGNDYYRTVSTDYYQCRTEEPGYSDADCYDDGSWDVNTFDVYKGNMQLDVETSKSFTAGFVWSPSPNFDLAVDYYQIRIANQVQSQSRELLRATEANCLLGVTDGGVAVDINSPTCVDALARVVREDPNDPFSTITSVLFAPINIANEETSGIDVTANYRLQTASAGDFRFTGNYTWAHRHNRVLYPGDPEEDMLDLSFSATTLPRTKGNVGVDWDKGAWGAGLFGNYVGRVANYNNDAWTGATWRFNGSARYDIIISEPSNPWVSGVASLFSDEFYDRIRNYLTDDGVLVQWIQIYEIEPELVASIIRALGRHFPNYEIYAADTGN
ncbi:TonB-dependent receptor domain-containing protein, partial [Thermomonas sp.]|uniref:TonB-dependent receptor domain-containing protein n=1 Tax=Thermomonas sp. TaxID=1971895 RepID=UPI003783176C